MQHLTNKELREKAQLEGKRTYMPSQPCANGHLVARSVARNVCPLCLRKPVPPNDNRLLASNMKAATTPCKNGHMAPRYFSGGCVACYKKEPPGETRYIFAKFNQTDYNKVKKFLESIGGALIG